MLWYEISGIRHAPKLKSAVTVKMQKVLYARKEADILNMITSAVRQFTHTPV